MTAPPTTPTEAYALLVGDIVHALPMSTNPTRYIRATRATYPDEFVVLQIESIETLDYRPGVKGRQYRLTFTNGGTATTLARSIWLRKG